MHSAVSAGSSLDAANPVLRTLLQLSPMAVFALDTAGRVRLWNPAAERIFGWTEAQVLGEPDPTVASQGRGHSLLEGLLAGAEYETRQERRRGRDGAWIDLALHAACLREEGGEPIGVLIVAIAPGEERRLEKERMALLETARAAQVEAEAAVHRARFLAAGSALLDSSLDYADTLSSIARLAVPALADFCLIDELDGDVVSPVALAHFRPDREGSLERRLRLPLAGEPDRPPVGRVTLTEEPLLVAKVDESVLRSIARNPQHLRRLRAMGLQSFLAVPLSARGRIFGVVTFAYLESGRRYTPADLEMAAELGRRAGLAVDNARLHRESQRAVSARERLLAVASHDLRNALATILLNTSAILDSPDPDLVVGDVLEQLGWIARSVEHMDRLIDLLDASATDLNHLFIEPECHSVSTLFREALLMYRSLAEAGGISLVWMERNDLPNILVDSRRIQQVLGNLISNAIRFSPPGASIVLGARADSDSEIVVTVADDGPGIEAKDLPSIFDFYWRGRTGRGRGAGLGLALSRAIVEAHHGRIWVESEPGRGSAFSFTVPSARAGAELDT